MPLNFISGGSSAPTGLPIPVEDDAERLSMEPPEGTHVKQASDGMTWVVFEGNWRKAPPLLADTQPNQVAAGFEFQSNPYPNPTVGTLEAVTVTSTSILPAQAWADNIEKFTTGPYFQNSIAISGATHIYDVLFAAWYYACDAASQTAFFDASGSAISNVSALLSAVVATGVAAPAAGGTFNFANADAQRISPYYDPIGLLQGAGASVSVRYTEPGIPELSDNTSWDAYVGATLVQPLYFDDSVGSYGLYFNLGTTSIVAQSGTSSILPSQLNLAGLNSLESVSLNEAYGVTGVINVPPSLLSFLANDSSLETLTLSNLSSLASVQTLNCTQLHSVRVENCPLLTSVDVNTCDLGGSALDQLIIDIHANAVAGAINGTLDVSNQTSAPTISETTKLGELIALHGWTVTT